MPTLSWSRRAVIGLVSGTALLAGISAQNGAAAVEALRIAIEGEYPPFNQTDKKGNLSGFDVDIANALCKSIDASCKLVKQQWNRMIPDLEAGKYELVVSSMSITAERRQKIDFTNPYYHTPAKFVAKKGAGYQITQAGLKGHKIGVQRATNHEQYLVSTYGSSAELVRYDTLPKAQADLVAGKVDLVFADSMAVYQGFLRTDKGKGFEFVGPDFRDQRWFGQGIGIGVRKGQSGLVARLNDALDAIQADGTYKRIEAKYFDFPLSARKTLVSQ